MALSRQESDVMFGVGCSGAEEQMGDLSPDVVLKEQGLTLTVAPDIAKVTVTFPPLGLENAAGNVALALSLGIDQVGEWFITTRCGGVPRYFAEAAIDDCKKRLGAVGLSALLAIWLNRASDISAVRRGRSGGQSQRRGTGDTAWSV